MRRYRGFRARVVARRHRRPECVLRRIPWPTTGSRSISIWEFETVSDPQISPDGSQIIYTRGWIDKVRTTGANRRSG